MVGTQTAAKRSSSPPLPQVLRHDSVCFPQVQHAGPHRWNGWHLCDLPQYKAHLRIPVHLPVGGRGDRSREFELTPAYDQIRDGQAAARHVRNGRAGFCTQRDPAREDSGTCRRYLPGQGASPGSRQRLRPLTRRPTDVSPHHREAGHQCQSLYRARGAALRRRDGQAYWGRSRRQRHANSCPDPAHHQQAQWAGSVGTNRL